MGPALAARASLGEVMDFIERIAQGLVAAATVFDQGRRFSSHRN